MDKAIHVRVGTRTHDQIRAVAEQEGVTISAAARDLIVDGLRQRWRDQQRQHAAPAPERAMPAAGEDAR